jgi:glycine cleavage system H protein
MSNDEFVPFMGYMWIQVEDGTLTIGINDDGINEITEISAVNLPTENEEVVADEVCGEIETESGPLNLYSPVDGKIIEVNGAVLENPALIEEDPYGDGWLFRVEPSDPDDIEDMEEELSDEDEEEDDE